MSNTVWHNYRNFNIAIDSRTNTPYISQIAPYDLTHYHWARKVPNMKRIILWNIYSPNGTIAERVQIPSMLDDYEEEKIIMDKLIYWDEKMKLRPCIDRT